MPRALASRAARRVPMSASTSPNAPASLKGGIDGDEYTVTPEMIAAFERDGYVHIPGVLTEAELAEVEEPMMRFIKGEVLPEGKDLCDMSGAVDRTPDEYTVFNAMLPRRYLPSMQGNVFERRAASIARQLTRGKDMSIDYDQLLAKRPGPRTPSSPGIRTWRTGRRWRRTRRLPRAGSPSTTPPSPTAHEVPPGQQQGIDAAKARSGED